MWLYGEENVPERYNNILGELKGKKLKTARGWALKEAIRGLWKCRGETLILCQDLCKMSLESNKSFNSRRTR